MNAFNGSKGGHSIKDRQGDQTYDNNACYGSCEAVGSLHRHVDEHPQRIFLFDDCEGDGSIHSEAEASGDSFWSMSDAVSGQRENTKDEMDNGDEAMKEALHRPVVSFGDSGIVSENGETDATAGETDATAKIVKRLRSASSAPVSAVTEIKEEEREEPAPDTDVCMQDTMPINHACFSGDLVRVEVPDSSCVSGQLWVLHIVTAVHEDGTVYAVPERAEIVRIDQYRRTAPLCPSVYEVEGEETQADWGAGLADGGGGVDSGSSAAGVAGGVELGYVNEPCCRGDLVRVRLPGLSGERESWVLHVVQGIDEQDGAVFAFSFYGDSIGINQYRRTAPLAWSVHQGESSETMTGESQGYGGGGVGSQRLFVSSLEEETEVLSEADRISLVEDHDSQDSLKSQDAADLLYGDIQRRSKGESGNFEAEELELKTELEKEMELLPEAGKQKSGAAEVKADDEEVEEEGKVSAVAGAGVVEMDDEETRDEVENGGQRPWVVDFRLSNPSPEAAHSMSDSISDQSQNTKDEMDDEAEEMKEALHRPVVSFGSNVVISDDTRITIPPTMTLASQPHASAPKCHAESQPETSSCPSCLGADQAKALEEQCNEMKVEETEESERKTELEKEMVMLPEAGSQESSDVEGVREEGSGQKSARACKPVAKTALWSFGTGPSGENVKVEGSCFEKFKETGGEEAEDEAKGEVGTADESNQGHACKDRESAELKDLSVSFCGTKRTMGFRGPQCKTVFFEDPKTRSSIDSDMTGENKSAFPFFLGAECSGDDAITDKASVTDDADLGFDAKKGVEATTGDGNMVTPVGGKLSPIEDGNHKPNGSSMTESRCMDVDVGTSSFSSNALTSVAVLASAVSPASPASSFAGSSELTPRVVQAQEFSETEKWREQWRESGFDEAAEQDKWRQFGKTRIDSRGAPLYGPEQEALTSVQLKALPPQTCGAHGLRKRVRASHDCGAAKETQGMKQYTGGWSPVASLLAAVRNQLGSWGAGMTGAFCRGTRRRQENKGQVLDRPGMAEKAPSKEKNTAIQV